MSGCLSPKAAKHHSQDAGLEEVTAYPSWSDAPQPRVGAMDPTVGSEEVVGCSAGSARQE